MWQFVLATIEKELKYKENECYEINPSLLAHWRYSKNVLKHPDVTQSKTNEQNKHTRNNDKAGISVFVAS